MPIMPHHAPTPSEMFRQELLDVMGPERGKITATSEEEILVEGQQAAAWFTNNRADGSGKRICAVRRGAEVRDIGFVHDLEPSGTERRYSKFMPQTPPFHSLEIVAGSIRDQLLGVTL